MLVRTIKDYDLTLFYFDSHGNYNDLVNAIEEYIDSGPTEKELFFFDKDAHFITPDQVKKIVPIASRSAKKRAPGGKTALMYGRISLYGLGRIYKVIEGKMVEKTWQTEVFKDLDETANWLGVSKQIVLDEINDHNMTSQDRPYTYQIGNHDSV